MADNLKLVSTVISVREQFEHGVVNKEVLMFLYQKYNYLPDVSTFVSHANRIFPKLNCGLASLYLRHILGQGEIVQGGYANHKHTFLKLNGNLIIDITADQYAGPTVYIGPFGSPWCVTTR